MKIKLRMELRDLPQDDVQVVLREQPWVSVVLPTKDRPEGAAAFLRSLFEAADPARTEVLVYAPEADPELAELLASFGASATVLDREVFGPGTPFSWATLMNHGFRRARGDWVMYASDDIVLQPDALRLALSSPECTAERVGGISFLHRNTVETYGGLFARYGYDTMMGERPYINFGLVRRTAFERTDGFDERYRFYWADVDICMQLQDAGFRIAVSQASRVEHVNVQDALRAGNSDAVFWNDTRAFKAKWRRHPFFRWRLRNPLPQVRFQLAHDRDAVRVGPRGPIVVDTVIFQIQRDGGIGRLWTECLTRLARGPLAPHLLLLDRDGTCPDFPGLRRRRFARYADGSAWRRELDARRVQRLCRREGASLFVSSYFTRAGSGTPSAAMVYDFVPEVLGWDLREGQWQAKREAIEQATAIAVISDSTRRDLERFYPSGERPVGLVTCGIGEAFGPRDAAAVEDFRTRHGLERPYFLCVGHRWPHKNLQLFLRAFIRLEQRKEIDVLFTGGAPELEASWRPYLECTRFHRLSLSQDDLACAYAGALGLVYPSLCEGFGMPVLEALACGCPVVTCPNSSLLEVGGEDVIYVGEDDVPGMRAALERLLDPAGRAAPATGGSARLAQYTWDRSVADLESFLQELSLPR